MSVKVDVGRSYRSQTRVEEWMTAEKAGNKGVDVLSTPNLIQRRTKFLSVRTST
jgi:hypothetical protein